MEFLTTKPPRPVTQSAEKPWGHLAQKKQEIAQKFLPNPALAALIEERRIPARGLVIYPRPAELILDGEKTLEVRGKKFRWPKGEQPLPQRIGILQKCMQTTRRAQLVGEITVESQNDSTLDYLRTNRNDEHQLNEEEFMTLSGKRDYIESVTIFRLSNPIKYENPRPYRSATNMGWVQLEGIRYDPMTGVMVSGPIDTPEASAFDQDLHYNDKFGRRHMKDFPPTPNPNYDDGEAHDCLPLALVAYADSEKLSDTLTGEFKGWTRGPYTLRQADEALRKLGFMLKVTQRPVSFPSVILQRGNPQGHAFLALGANSTSKPGTSEWTTPSNPVFGDDSDFLCARIVLDDGEPIDLDEPEILLLWGSHAQVINQNELDVEENSDSDDDSSDCETDNLNSFHEGIRKEYQAYCSLLRWSNVPRVNEGIRAFPCKLCPFRSFDRKSRLIDHVEKYHTPPKYSAIGCDAQYSTAKAVYLHNKLTNLWGHPSEEGCCLAIAAARLHAHCEATEEEEDFLRRNNEIRMVLVWTETGPRYLLRSHLGTCRRANKDIYYTQGFAQMVFSRALTSKGKIRVLASYLQNDFAKGDGVAAMLVPTKHRSGLFDVIKEIFEEDAAKKLRAELLNQAICRQEFVALSHDATFKAAFGLIGQRKMDQKDGYHALHTFCGATGCCFGFSPQLKESPECTEAAAMKLLPKEALCQVKYFFSDAPSEAVREWLPNLVGVAEDPLHLVFRCEYCTGGRRTALTGKLRQLQSKFFIASTQDDAMVYKGENAPQSIVNDELPLLDWDSYIKLPFKSHADYIRALDRLAEAYPQDLMRKDDKGNTMRDVLTRGSSARHYLYLMNNSVFRMMHDGRLPSGTL